MQHAFYHILIYFQGSSSSSKEELTKEGQCQVMMATAELCLDNLINSVEKGTVTVATLKLLEEHSTQFLRLGEIHQKNQNVAISIKDSFSRRRSELKAFITLKDQLTCLNYFSSIFTSGISIIILFQIDLNVIYL